MPINSAITLIAIKKRNISTLINTSIKDLSNEATFLFTSCKVILNKIRRGYIEKDKDTKIHQPYNWSPDFEPGAVRTFQWNAPS